MPKNKYVNVISPFQAKYHINLKKLPYFIRFMKYFPYFCRQITKLDKIFRI